MVPSERSCGRGVWVSTMLGAHQKKAHVPHAPARHTPPPAGLLCLRPARQDAAYGRARWTSALPEPQQPSGCCVQALRDPWGQACWLREQPHPIAGDSAHRPLAAMRPHPTAGNARTRPLGAERPQQGEGLGAEPGMHYPRGFGVQRVHGRACGEKERAHVRAAKCQVGRNFRRANDP
jgi:hypothetical protein